MVKKQSNFQLLKILAMLMNSVALFSIKECVQR